MVCRANQKGSTNGDHALNKYLLVEVKKLLSQLAAAAITKPRRPGALDDKLIPLRSGDKKSKFKLLTDAVSGLKTVFLLCPHGVAEARELPGVARRKH